MPTVPPTRLDTPTIGAWRRAHGHTSWSDNARHLFAVTLATEAQRAAIIARLDDIARTALVLTPDQTINRLATLIVEATP